MPLDQLLDPPIGVVAINAHDEGAQWATSRPNDGFLPVGRGALAATPPRTTTAKEPEAPHAPLGHLDGMRIMHGPITLYFLEAYRRPVVGRVTGVRDGPHGCARPLARELMKHRLAF